MSGRTAEGPGRDVALVLLALPGDHPAWETAVQVGVMAPDGFWAAPPDEWPASQVAELWAALDGTATEVPEKERLLASLKAVCNCGRYGPVRKALAQDEAVTFVLRAFPGAVEVTPTGQAKRGPSQKRHPHRESVLL